MNRYEYDGPVYEFDSCINKEWHGTTMAISEKKARSNLVYQYKRNSNRSKDSNVILPGKIHIIEKESFK